MTTMCLVGVLPPQLCEVRSDTSPAAILLRLLFINVKRVSSPAHLPKQIFIPYHKPDPDLEPDRDPDSYPDPDPDPHPDPTTTTATITAALPAIAAATVTTTATVAVTTATVSIESTVTVACMLDCHETNRHIPP